MKPAPFTYHLAHTSEEAVALLGQLGDDARLIAGGQSLGPMLNLRAARPSHVIDISRIDALHVLNQADDGAIRLGAAVSHAQIEDAPLLGEAGALLKFVAAGIAYRSVRNRGTIGGSVAHADPAADGPPALCALAATARVASANGSRIVAMRDFFRGYFETALEPGDVLTQIDVPALPTRTRWSLTKEVNHHGGFAQAIALCIAPPDSMPTLWIGAIGDRPIDLSLIVGSLPGRTWNAEVGGIFYAEIIEAIRAKQIDGTGDLARYRLHLHAANAVAAIERVSSS